MNRRYEPVALHVQLVLELFQDSFVHNPYFPISLSPYYFPMSLFPVSQLNTFQVIGGTVMVVFTPNTLRQRQRGERFGSLHPQESMLVQVHATSSACTGAR